MKIRKRTFDTALNAVSRLVEMEYVPQNQELNDIHRRLMKGRRDFELAATKTMDAVIRMSAMDLTLESSAASRQAPRRELHLMSQRHMKI